ncbi:MAG: DNA (cytosine-5-)-methyltransferase [Burkholderiales bacterium]|nr:DNA (cytosine-5-)-methyltransferase [Burkholderiales bacterium]
MKAQKEVKFIDLFAGIGGFHFALSDFNTKCVFASEIDKHASNTYVHNYGIMPHGDITKINESSIPKHDILCAGFPCQAFSISGNQKGFNDIRGTLFFEIARIVKFHKPKVLLLENVKNLVNHNNGDTLNTILDTLYDLNYTVYYEILNASNYQLPQNRERVYFVCFRNDMNIHNFFFPKHIDKKTALYEILELNPANVKIVDRKDVELKEYTPQLNIFNEYELPNKPIQIGIVNKGGQGERIYSDFGHAITLSAYGGGIGSKTGLYKINNVIRKLSPRECARVQGFSDSFEIVSSPSQSYKQFGNSVATSVLKAIINEIMKVY